MGPRSAWYPVSTSSECRKASVMCWNRNGDEFECAPGDRCCGDICVSKDDVCCENVYGRRRWLLRKRMLCTRQQVLQVSLEGESQLVSSHLGHQVRFLEQLAWCTLAKNSWSEVPVS